MVRRPWYAKLLWWRKARHKAEDQATIINTTIRAITDENPPAHHYIWKKK